MYKIAVKVENIGKKYIIKHQNYKSLHYAVDQNIKNIINFFNPFSDKFGSFNRARKENLWALRTINFEANYGDWIGIIGDNGAGKTTLLQLLSRITAPTVGKIYINGCMASLLGIGTGFHKELTGRENIFLNGSIIGIEREKIEAKFDDIVAFSECEKFLDVPSKRYSSGINLRLAFAVAIHLRPDILIIDETLAVGDKNFKKKCFAKMQEIRQEGITVLFATHSLDSVKKFCNKALLLHKGQLIKYSEDVDSVIALYNNIKPFN